MPHFAQNPRREAACPTSPFPRGEKPPALSVLLGGMPQAPIVSPPSGGRGRRQRWGNATRNPKPITPTHSQLDKFTPSVSNQNMISAPVSRAACIRELRLADDEHVLCEESNPLLAEQPTTQSNSPEQNRTESNRNRTTPNNTERNRAQSNRTNLRIQRPGRRIRPRNPTFDAEILASFRFATKAGLDPTSTRQKPSLRRRPYPLPPSRRMRASPTRRVIRRRSVSSRKAWAILRLVPIRSRISASVARSVSASNARVSSTIAS